MQEDLATSKQNRDIQKALGQYLYLRQSLFVPMLPYFLVINQSLDHN